MASARPGARNMAIFDAWSPQLRCIQVALSGDHTLPGKPGYLSRSAVELRPPTCNCCNISYTVVIHHISSYHLVACPCNPFNSCCFHEQMYKSFFDEFRYKNHNVFVCATALVGFSSSLHAQIDQRKQASLQLGDCAKRTKKTGRSPPTAQISTWTGPSNCQIVILGSGSSGRSLWNVLPWISRPSTSPLTNRPKF